MSNRRRKSLSIFAPDVSALTPIDKPPDSAPAGSGNLLKKRRRPATLFTSSPLSSPNSSDMPSQGPPTPIPIKRADSKSSLDRLFTKARPRSLQKNGRPPSVFGSLRSLHTSQEHDDGLTRTTSIPTSLHSTSSAATGIYSGAVLHHGEVQTAGGMFRKRSIYFVLTDTHLLRFKSQARAAELFPCIPSSIGRASGMRHSRMSSKSSSGSLHELHTTSSGEGNAGIPLTQIVAVWRLEDGKPYFSIEVNHFDDDSNAAGSVTLQLNDPGEYELWLSSIRGAVIKARLTDPQMFISQDLVSYTARAVEQDGDYDPEHFQLYKVTQRAGKTNARSSSEDLTKLSSNVCMLAIGIHKVHLLPLPRSSGRASSTSLSEVNGVCYGLTTLIHINVNEHDDSFSLTFRLPFHQSSTLTLASSVLNDIALSIRHAADYLRPHWAEAPFTWNVPNSLDDQVWELPVSEEPHECLLRTMTAYCVGYGIDASKISYDVVDHGDDAPTFCLFPPLDRSRTKYTKLELLAILRSLRYNESFTSLSFQNISLDVLHNLRDRHGHDHAPDTTKSGEPLNIPDQLTSTLLVQEVRALAVKCRRLRRLDFSYCLDRSFSNDGELSQDPGCGICEALFPLCERQWTNIDWIILDGIHLTDIDIDYLFTAAINRSCHFRGLELGHCALTDHSIQTVLQAISNQAATLESIDLSGNLARQEPKALQSSMVDLEFLRKVNLSNINRTTGPEALLSGNTLCAWKLSDLRLSKTTLNQATVESLTLYLRNKQSDYLRVLELDRCSLTGGDAATLLNAMDRGIDEVRNLFLNLSENQLEQHHEALVDAVLRSCTPSRVSMQMLEYRSEKNLQRLLEAFTKNISTTALDISRLSLQNDASDETCDLLRRLFVENHRIENLDISGEQSHLEATHYGSGLNKGLLGLMHNKSLQILQVRHQKLGLQGANTLSSILGVNDTLRELHVENNEINLQAFTVLVNALEHNTTLLYLSPMDNDRAWTQQKVDKEVESMRSPTSSVPSSVAAISNSTKATVNRTLGRTMGKTLRGASKSLSGRNSDRSTSLLYEYSDKDIKAAMGSLSQNWDREILRRDEYIQRNCNLFYGSLADGQEDLVGPPLLDIDRPGTSESLATALRNINIDDDKTPIAEVERQLVLSDDSPKSELDVDLMDGEEEDLEDSMLEMKEHLHV